MATKRFAILGERESTVVKLVRVLAIASFTVAVFVGGLAVVVVAVTD